MTARLIATLTGTMRQWAAAADALRDERRGGYLSGDTPATNLQPPKSGMTKPMMPLAAVLLEPGSIRRIHDRDWQIIASVGDRLIAVPADTPTLTIPEEDA